MRVAYIAYKLVIGTSTENDIQLTAKINEWLPGNSV